jgi:hypothetical protein
MSLFWPVPKEKSNMESWAEREVEIACKHERGDAPEGEWDYGCACYESALKAFNSLLGDGHSGCSIGITKSILNRLIDGTPLTPIEDTDDIWNQISEKGPDHESIGYQCKRLTSLFKNVYPDGTVKYSDVDSYRCHDIHGNGIYYNGLVHHIIDEMFPIAMPYIPGEPIRVYCEEFLTDKKNGDFDTVGVFYAVLNDGKRVDIDRYFKEGEDDQIEITAEEYQERHKC